MMLGEERVKTTNSAQEQNRLRGGSSTLDVNLNPRRSQLKIQIGIMIVLTYHFYHPLCIW